MPYEPKPGDVSAFKNDKKGNDKAPDFKGYVVTHRDIKAGVKIELALWERKGTQGGWFYSGKVGDPRTKAAPAEDADRIPY